VLQVGENVRQFKEGDLVHGMWMHRQTALVPEDKLYPIRNGENVERVLFTDPARFALAGIHDAQIKLGDRVAIFGLGAIGMLAIQMAHLNGAAQVFAIDPNPSRRQIAKSIGADFALDPAEIDAGIAIKEATFSKGVDVAIEISGVYSALQQALRSVHKEGTVVTVSYYGQQLNHVDLSKEWHHNRITLRSSMPGWGCASRFYPMWDLARLEQTVITMIEEQKLDVDPMFGDRISFHNAPLEYEKIDRSLESGVKVIFVYD
jgi:threonine dehydrogenase-like Zn-dependent dehydrogenase